MKKMYIFVRLDLDNVYRMVQRTHALAQFALDFPEEFRQWNNSTIVFVKIKSEYKMMDVIFHVDRNKLPFATFNEPDIGLELTSVACYCDEDYMKSYQLAN